MAAREKDEPMSSLEGDLLHYTNYLVTFDGDDVNGLMYGYEGDDER